MARLGIAQPHIIEAILGHLRSGSQAGVAGIYSVDVRAQQGIALQRWADVMGHDHR